MALQAGDVFGRYELVSWLGRGGMAETWRAQLVGDAGVTKPVLIKKVLPEYANDEAFISMFISEARISATLSHGNVAQVFDFGRVDGEYFLAMEFVDGQPLHRVLKRAVKSGMSALPIPVAVFIALEMCRGLHYAHTRTNGSGTPLGIVHRDISPDNVLLGYEGQVKIVDFGIAKAQLLRGFKTAPGVVKGKYLFFSPEQARGEDVDARTDVWATGVVLYELLCGKLPVEGAPHVVMMRLGRGEIPAPSVLRPDLPQELNDIVMRALTPDRELRFESSHAFGDALAGFLYSNFPRFSSMSIAHLLRVLFRGDLVQEGRELSVPGSFLEEMKSWREPTPLPEPAPPLPPVSERQTRRLKAVSPPVPTETTEPHALEASSGASRRLIYGLSAGGLLTVGACLWFLILQEPHPSQIESAAPPPRPILPTVKVEPPTETKVAEPAPARPPLFDEKTVVAKASPQAPPTYLQEVQEAVRLALREHEVPRAQELANDCLRRYPQTPECHLMLGVVNAVLKDFKESHAHYMKFVELTPNGYPKRDLVIKALSKLEVEGRAADTSPPQAPTGSPLQASANLRQQADDLTTKQKYVAALAKAELCIQADPTFADCEFSLGYIHSKLGNAQQSEQHYEKFLGIAPIDHPKRARVINILGSTKKTSR
ncbi:serine/threonine protein kinase [Corallococcus silvisoli]|uniref:serine/threonine protein kinase n=1 Tax=Corallococcus silvisoli TaxID=2697031 RepID=UPI0013778760|nr:serine/threonine-protein kinase [Corallococcus silvisoli]NBD08091.1 protein kinase [Corallococcus silvisoli]